MQLPRHPQVPNSAKQPLGLISDLISGLISGLLTVALCLTSCATPAADEERPGVQELLRGELRDAWATEAKAGTYQGGGTDAASGEAVPFWATFNDEILNELVVDALQHNHDLVASAQRLRGVAARSRVARAARRPQANASTDYARQQNVFVGFPIPGSPGPLRTLFNQANAGVDVAWEVDLWGRLAASVNAADSEVAASFSDLQAARLSIAAQVTNAWFALREAAEQVELAERTTATFQSSANVVRDRFEAGLSGALDLRLAEANTANSAALGVSARQNYRVTSRQIELLLGRFPSAELESVGDFHALPPAVPAGVPADVLARRPDLVAAEHLVSAAEFRAKAARLDRWPTLVLTASGGTTSDVFSDLLDGDFSVWRLAAAIAGPLIDGGRRRAVVDEALANMRAVRAQFASLALQAFFEVENALDAEILLRERLAFLEMAVDSSSSATTLSEEQYKEGLVSIELVLESQRRQLNAESAYLTARRELFQSRVDLHLALGGNFVVEAEPGQSPSEAALEAAAEAETSGTGPALNSDL